MAQTTIAPQFTTLEAQLIKETYITSGAQPNFSVTIPNVTSLEELSGKQFKIINHVPFPFGANITLSINGLPAKNISNYKMANTTFRQTSLEGQIWTLMYNGTVFVLNDFGDSGPVSTANVTQTISGKKSFNDQVEIISALGLGISSSGGFIYTKQNSRYSDAVGDIRLYAWDGNLFVQKCTAILTSGNVKGSGTWLTVSRTVAQTQAVSVNQLPYETTFTLTPSTPINIGTRAVDLTPLFGEGIKTSQGADLFTYDKATGVIKFTSPSADYTNFGIDLRVNGIIFASAGDYSQYKLYLTRPDGVVNEQLPSIDCPKITGANASLTNTQLGTLRVRVLGANDPFVTQGFRIWAVKERGTDLQLTAGKEQKLLLLR